MKIIKRGRNFREIVAAIRGGEVVVMPTDTVYGLVADATSMSTVEKIFEIKKRRDKKPAPIFIRNLKMAKRLAEINKRQEEFLKLVWPGKITAILRPKGKLPKGIGRPGREVGLRMSSHKIISQLLAILKFPLTATSANISGKPSSTRIKEVIVQFKNQRYQPDLVVDGGNLPENEPSTIIDLTVWPPKILRP